MKIIEQNIKVCGLVTELTKSQSENFGIIQSHWSEFNTELKRKKLNQNGGNWTKYGITFKTDKKYFYLTAIPVSNLTIPDNFKHLEIPKGEYLVYSHKGKWKILKTQFLRFIKLFYPSQI